MPNIFDADMACEAADGLKSSIALRNGRSKRSPVDGCLRVDIRVPALSRKGGKALEQVLTNLKEGESIEAERFFLINKNLFYFFHMIYGGGPAIVNNKIFA